MHYMVCEWIHRESDDPVYPVYIYSELDDERWERRKVEVFRDGTMQSADELHGQGSTGLGEVSVPSHEEINSDPQFRAREISKAEFEQIWTRAHEKTKDKNGAGIS